MTDQKKLELIKTSWELHGLIETTYLDHPEKKGEDKWLEKQRLLLAEMTFHLLQTSIRPGEIQLDNLRTNLHSILTITDQFLPEPDLKQTTENLY